MLTSLLGLVFATPAVPNDIGGKYVAGAYIVFILLLVIYVAIMARKMAGIERGLREVTEIAEARKEDAAPGQAAPGGGSEEPSSADSLAPRESRGAGA